ncbi:hypothetical protein GOP47_0010149 [Adiantum capillus-veneris]|uniref:Uncharacterized protein n=1 Tax=Adiantum capillus-veneris TaxID=13818 RepID=A0A9D4UU81_ADICA|nr:hypothetical protein GOP47_0010149 [Adiantum capillus-veneris]
MEEHDRYLVPRSKLSESIHGSWLATNNGFKYMSLYEACLSDLTASCLQGGWHAAFLKGQHIGSGPRLCKLQQRDAMWKKRSYSQRNIIDLTTEVVEEIGVGAEADIGYENTTTERKKRPRSIVSPIHEFYSHQPEFQRITKPVPRRHSYPTASASQNEGTTQISEVDVSPTLWAI